MEDQNLSFRIHRAFESINDEIYPWIASQFGWWPCQPLSEKAIAWLMENEPGFKEQITSLLFQISNYNPEAEEQPSIKAPAAKSGYIYIIKAAGTNLYKIGLTTAQKPESRIKNIQTSSPVDIETIGFFKVDDVEKIESEIHEKLKRYRQAGEWFKTNIALINKAIKPYGVKL